MTCVFHVAQFDKAFKHYACLCYIASTSWAVWQRMTWGTRPSRKGIESEE